MFYHQCLLERPVDGGRVSQVSYLPAKYAVVGKTLKLRDEDGSWTDGWVVTSAGEPVDAETLPDPHDAVKAHRRATGDAMPRRPTA